MLHSGRDQKILLKIKNLVTEIKFPDEKDNNLLMKWFEDLKNAPDILPESISTGSEANGTMRIKFPSTPGFGNIQKFDDELELLQGIKDALEKSDEYSAQAKLRQLTGKLDKLGLAAFYFGLFVVVGLLGMLLYNLNEPPIDEPMDEIERIRRQFPKRSGYHAD